MRVDVVSSLLQVGLAGTMSEVDAGHYFGAPSYWRVNLLPVQSEGLQRDLLHTSTPATIILIHERMMRPGYEWQMDLRLRLHGDVQPLEVPQ